MKVYTASGWIAASSASVATLATFEFVATAGQTVFSGTDANGATLSYVAPALIVTLNGVRLRPGDDYTASNGTSITLVSAAALNDELVVDAFGSFLVANTYTIAQADAKFVELAGDTMTGKLTIAQSNSGGVPAIHLTQDESTIQGPSSNTQIRMGGNLVLGAAGQASINTGGTARVVIDSSGRVTTPAQPAFSASNNFGAGYLSIDISNPFPFNVTRINIGSHYNTSTYRFTAPIAGVYQFTYSLFYEAGQGQNNHDTALYVNGADLMGGPGASDQIGSRPGTDRITVVHTALISLSANDYVEVRARESTSGGIYGPHSTFSGYLLG